MILMMREHVCWRGVVGGFSRRGGYLRHNLGTGRDWHAYGRRCSGLLRARVNLRLGGFLAMEINHCFTWRWIRGNFDCLRFFCLGYFVCLVGGLASLHRIFLCLGFRHGGASCTLQSVSLFHGSLSFFLGLQSNLGLLLWTNVTHQLLHHNPQSAVILDHFIECIPLPGARLEILWLLSLKSP